MQINTNMTALFSYRTLSNQQQHLGRAIQRLSSGLRINNAADDVAGMAIADRMTARVRSLNQVHRNANDGISLLQTADSALGNIGDVLQRIREIAVQSANDSYTGTDRGSMQREVNQLLQEVNRISIDTKFNGKTLMDGEGSGGSADADEQLVIDGLRGSWLRESESLIKTYYGLEGSGRELDIKLEYQGNGGNLAWVTSGYTGATLTSLSLTVDMEDFIPPDQIGGTDIDRVIAHEMVHGLMADNMYLPDLNTNLWFTEGTAEFIHGADERVVNELAGVGGNVATFVNAAGGASSSLEYASGYIAVRYLHENAIGGIKSVMDQLKNGASLDDAIIATTGYGGAADFLSDYKGLGGQTYFQGLVNGGYLTNADTGAIGGADADGGAIRTAESVIPDTGGYTLDPLSGFTEKWPGGFDNKVPSRNSFDLQVGEKAGDRLQVSIGATTVQALGLSGINVATAPNTVIDKVDQALTYLNEQRGEVGAGLSRLGHLINVNAINIETTSDARSRILDADYAQETGELVRRQILLQAGQSMMAQANAAPRQVLSLLTG